MTRNQAHDLLRQASAGAAVSVYAITRALLVTGDIGPSRPHSPRESVPSQQTPADPPRAVSFEHLRVLPAIPERGHMPTIVRRAEVSA